MHIPATYFRSKVNNFSTYALGFQSTPVVPAEIEEPIIPGGGGGSVTTYTISGADTVNGKLTVSSKTAATGSTVTITAEPDEGFVLGTLTVVDKKGTEVELTDKGDGVYSFKMPAAVVHRSHPLGAEQQDRGGLQHRCLRPEQ